MTKIFKEEPDDPGVAHYIIHSYDYPPLAPMALNAARRYAKIAPDAPHALHISSHIFTRLGLWDESISSNRAAAAAGHRYGWHGEELHATDYLMYAYLQQGRDREARQLLANLPAVQTTDSNYRASLYAIGAMLARFVLERRQWREAEALEPPAGFLPPARFAWTEAAIRFANGIGAPGRPRQSGRGSRGTAANPQGSARGRGSSLGWANRSSAPRSRRVEVRQPEQALAEYEAVLRVAPNRLNALYGAGYAAELAGQKKKTGAFYLSLLKLCASADGNRPALEHARRFLSKEKTRSQ